MNDNAAYRFPVSIKGVIVRNGRVVLLRNQRREWELPGGKLEPGETSEGCLAREIAEELGLAVTVGPILDTWIYEIGPAVRVFVTTYGCVERVRVEPVLSAEHEAVGWFALDAVDALPMPDGYKRSVATWSRHLAADGTR